MSTRRTLQVLTFVFALLVALPSATATVCVDVDAERDSFDASQQKATRILVEERLQKADKEIGSEDCDATYTVYNLKFGDTIVATLSGPQGQRKLEADSVEELPETYDQLVTSLLEGKTTEEATNRKNVTDGQTNDKRLDADTVVYASTGYGGTFGADYAAGPSIAFGWRHEIRHFAIDFSVADVTIPTNQQDVSPGPSGSWFRVGVMYLFNQYASHTPYVGAGLGFGVTNVEQNVNSSTQDEISFQGRGVNVDISGGYELFRASNVRLFIQGDVVLPTYKSQVNDYQQDETSTNSRYTPGFELSMGGGFSF